MGDNKFQPSAQAGQTSKARYAPSGGGGNPPVLISLTGVTCTPTLLPQTSGCAWGHVLHGVSA